MGQLVFQATLGGQVNLVGPNTASTFNLNVPAVSSTLSTTSGTETLTNKTLTTPVINGFTGDTSVVNIGSGQFYKDTAGNIGVGVTPSAWRNTYNAFQIGIGGALFGRTATQDQVNVSANYYVNTSNADTYIGTGYATLYKQNTGQHQWYNAASGTAGNAITFTQAMTLDASGNLLVGVTSALGKFSVLQGSSSNGDTVVLKASTASAGGSQPGVKFLSNADANLAQVFADVNSGALITNVNGSERARIDSSGNLLVGTTSNSINGSFGSGFTSSNTNGGSGNLFVYNSASSSGDTAPCLALQKAMTTTSSSARFVQFYANGTGTPMGGIVGNGASNVQFASISDEREKTNIQSITGSLSKINALRPVEFDWIADGSHVPAGFVAQEVETVFPEFVVENMSNDGQEERKGLTGGMTGGIVAHLVKAIQEQQAIITSLTARIEALEA